MTKLLRLPAVSEAVGLPASTIYALARAGKFPRPVKLGARSSAWRSDQIAEWIESRRPSGFQ